MDALQNTLHEEVNADLTESTFLTFHVNQVQMGLPVTDIIQIIEMQEITPLPEFPAYTKGVINLRGNIISVVDLSMKLFGVETTRDEKTCIIIVNVNHILIGFIIDEVDEVKNIANDAIVKLDDLYNEAIHEYLIGIVKSEPVLLLLDSYKLFN